MWLLSASLRPPPLEYMKLQALLCFKAVETPFLLIFQNASIITEKGVIIGLLTETTKQNILTFPKKTI